MRAVAIFSLFASLVAGVCFDNGDCLLTPHATCSKTKGGLLGDCVASATATGGSGKPTGNICFDDGDCLLSPHTTCSKTKGGILGNCAATATAVVTGGSAKPTGNVCFDDGDCILGGGKCVKPAGKFIGYVPGACGHNVKVRDADRDLATAPSRPSGRVYLIMN